MICLLLDSIYKAQINTDYICIIIIKIQYILHVMYEVQQIE